MVTDYDESLGYDADHDDPSQFCRHGNFIGSWWGPDYLCHWCESGEEPPTRAQMLADARETLERGAALYDEMVARVADVIAGPDVPIDRRARLRHELIRCAHAFGRDAERAWDLLSDQLEPT